MGTDDVDTSDLGISDVDIGESALLTLTLAGGFARTRTRRRPSTGPPNTAEAASESGIISTYINKNNNDCYSSLILSRETDEPAEFGRADLGVPVGLKVYG